MPPAPSPSFGASKATRDGVRVVCEQRKRKYPKRWPADARTTFGMMEPDGYYGRVGTGGWGEPESLTLDFGASISTLTRLFETSDR